MLDYLRGIMALSILVYHYSMWSNISWFYPFDQTLSRLGIYAVSTFYVISGASLAYVYAHKTVNADFIKEFGIKRFFRIAPLFWVVTTATIVLRIYRWYTTDFAVLPDIKSIILNYTLTFGWLDHDNYIATGAWSIGNELVFYSLFPLMLYLINKSKWFFALFCVVSLTMSFYISEIIIDNSNLLRDEWSIYINPLNQLYLFVGGFLIGYLLRQGFSINKKKLLSIALVSLISFMLFPDFGSDQIIYVNGFYKILFSIIVFSLVMFAAYYGNLKRSIVTNTLNYFGKFHIQYIYFIPLHITFINKLLS